MESRTSERKRAFAYCRVSGLGQVGGDGFPRQRAAIEAYAKSHGYEIVAWYEEKGVCGATEWEDRPAWSEMIEALNGVRTIIVEKLDRLARELFIQEYILRDLRKREVVLVTAASEETGNEDPTRVLFRQILGAIAEYDRVMTVRKLKASRDRARRRDGRNEGQKYYGELEGEACWAASIRQMRREGSTLLEIADALNKTGVKPRRGKQWYASSVKNVVDGEERLARRLEVNRAMA